MIACILPKNHGGEGSFKRSGLKSSSSATPSNLVTPRDEYAKPEEEDNALLISLQPSLLVGKFLGVVPIQGLLQSSSENLKFRRASVAAMLCLWGAFAMFASATVGVIDIARDSASNINDSMLAFQLVTFACVVVFEFLYCYSHAGDLIRIIQELTTLKIRFARPDRRLRFDGALITAILITSAIMENALYDVSIAFSQAEEALNNQTLTKNSSALEVYYNYCQARWAKVIPFSVPILAVTFFNHKLGLYAWNYIDVLIILLARVVYFKFKALLQEAEVVLVNPRNFGDANIWHQICEDHRVLRGMLKKVSRFLSPLVFSSYGLNIMFICLQLHVTLKLESNRTLLAKVYAFWSFLHLMLRLFLITESGARIHYWAHEINELFSRCPDHVYSPKVERAHRFINSSSIGLSGCGCFTITKPLMLQIMGVIFTLEIVLLQATHKPFLPGY